MKKVIRLTESQLVNLIKRTIKEDEQEAMMSTIESDPKLSRQFDKVVNYLSGLDPEQQEQIQDIALGGEEMQGEYTEGRRTVYKDYGPDRGPVEISKSEFIKRKLLSVLPASIVGAIMGIAMAGGMSADDVLQMALGTAAVTGGIGAGLISTVGRETVDVPDEEEMGDEEKPMSESYRRKRVVRLTESDLIRLVKRIIKENEDEYLYHHPASMGSGKWYRNTFMGQGDAEEFSDDDLDIEDMSIDDVDDNVIAPRFRDFYKKASPTIKRAKLRKP
jgi:hypothetical protein